MTLVLARTDKRGNAVVATDTRVTQKDHERNKLGFFDADLLDPPRPKVWLEPRGWCVTAGLDTREARRALQEAGSGDASVLAQVVREMVPEHLFPNAAIIVVPRVGELMAVMDAGERMAGGLFWAGCPNGLSESQKDDWDGWLQSAAPLTSNIPGFVHWCALFHLALYNMLGEEGSISPRAEFGIVQSGEAGYIPPTPVDRIVQLSDREIQDMIQPPPARVEDEALERPLVHHTSIDGGELIRVRDPVNSRFVAGEDVFDKSDNDLDDVPDGGNFARVLLADTNSNRIKKLPADTEAEGDIYVADTGAPQVGTVASPSSLTKTIRIPASELIASTDARQWSIAGDGAISPRSTGSSETFYGSVVMPPGVTAVDVAANGSRADAADTMEVVFLKTTGVGVTGTTITTLTHSTTGAQTISSSISETISASNMYFIEVTLESTSSFTDAKFAYFEIDYTMPSYDKGY